MHTRSARFPTGPGAEGRMDQEELLAAWHLLRSVARRLDLVAEQEGWPKPFAPARYLILVRLERATAYGLSHRRLAQSLGVPPSTLAHHLDVLEQAGLLRRASWTLHDGRKVAVRLTHEGRYAVRRLTRGP